MRLCRLAENSPKNSNENSENAGIFRGEYAFPVQTDWDSNYGEANSFGNLVRNCILLKIHCMELIDFKSKFRVRIMYFFKTAFLIRFKL